MLLLNTKKMEILTSLQTLATVSTVQLIRMLENCIILTEIVSLLSSLLRLLMRLRASLKIFLLAVRLNNHKQTS